MTSVFAHRGATGRHPGNTIGAFADARALGANGVELDVRLGADGALVVHHDALLPGGLPVARARPADLPPEVPLRAAALAACAGMVVNLELKAPAGPGEGGALAVAVASGVRDAGWTDRVVVSSFDADLLEAVRAADDRLPLAWLFKVTADPSAALSAAIGRRYDGIHPFVTQASPALVERARSEGLAVRVWTVNHPADLGAMVERGVDAVITDRVAEAVAMTRPKSG